MRPCYGQDKMRALSPLSPISAHFPLSSPSLHPRPYAACVRASTTGASARAQAYALMRARARASPHPRARTRTHASARTQGGRATGAYSSARTRAWSTMACHARTRRARTRTDRARGGQAGHVMPPVPFGRAGRLLPSTARIEQVRPEERERREEREGEREEA